VVWEGKCPEKSVAARWASVAAEGGHLWQQNVGICGSKVGMMPQLAALVASTSAITQRSGKQSCKR